MILAFCCAYCDFRKEFESIKKPENFRPMSSEVYKAFCSVKIHIGAMHSKKEWIEPKLYKVKRIEKLEVVL